MTSSSLWRWFLGAGLAVLVAGTPFVYYRWEYTNHKRLREVVPGVCYRSGQLTVPGFIDAVERLHIRSVINLQDEFPDPDVSSRYFGGGSEKESDLCQRLGLRYYYMPPDLLPRSRALRERPAAVDRFLEIMDDPANYPVLIHCRAGLHRTGVIAALYRLEYQDWNADLAIQELKANGFGRFPCSRANAYIAQYILNYQPRKKAGEGGKLTR